MKLRASLLTLTALAALAACSDNTPPPVAAAPEPAPAPAPPPPAPPPGLDGRYVGSLALDKGQPNSCRPRRMPVTVVVAGGNATVTSGRNPGAQAPLGPDGSVSYSLNDWQGTATFADGKLAGTATKGDCSYTLTGTKAGAQPRHARTMHRHHH